MASLARPRRFFTDIGTALAEHGADRRRGSTIYVGTSIALSLRYVAPAARLSNAQDTRIGGAIADAVTCNTVVKSFGAEAREDLRLGKLLNKWHHRTARTWVFATRSGESQSTLLLALRTAITSYAVLLWWRGKAIRAMSPSS